MPRKTPCARAQERNGRDFAHTSAAAHMYTYGWVTRMILLSEKEKKKRSIVGRATYRLHGSCHIVISLSLLGQPGLLHQLLAVHHVGC